MSDTISKTFSVTGVRAISFSALGTVNIIQDGQESLLVEASPEILEHIKVEQEGSHVQVRLYTWYDFLFLPKPARFTFHVKDLDSFSLSGSAEIECESLETKAFDLSVSGSGHIHMGALKSETLKMSSSGSGHFEMGQIEATAVTATLSGSGKFTLTGSADSASFRISGSGEVAAADLSTRTEEIHVSGSARASLQASESLDIRISGAGDISYKGNPKVHQSISGSGSIRQIQAV